MNKDEAIAKLITDTLDFLKSTKDFAMAQAPDLARQAVILETATMISIFIVSLATVYFGFFLWKKGEELSIESKKQKMTYYEDGFNFKCPGIILGSIGALVAIVSFFGFLKVILAPKLFLIEELTRLVGRRC